MYISATGLFILFMFFWMLSNGNRNNNCSNSDLHFPNAEYDMRDYKPSPKKIEKPKDILPTKVEEPITFTTGNYIAAIIVFVVLPITILLIKG